jgi:hypothetical protein
MQKYNVELLSNVQNEIAIGLQDHINPIQFRNIWVQGSRIDNRHEAVLDRFRCVAPEKPMFSADSSWGVAYPPQMPEPLGPQCVNEEVRARRFKEVYHAAFSPRDFIGWGWRGWMDKWAIAEPDMQHGGLQDAFGK